MTFSSFATIDSGHSQLATTIPMQQVVVDLVNRSLRCDALRISLTPGEFSLLMFFLRARGRVLSRDEIIAHVNGDDSPVTERSVDVRIAGLRRKLRPLGQPITTVRRAGYRFRDDAELVWRIGDGFTDSTAIQDEPAGG
jgi:DNA-binding response OmpR family regulator